MSGNLFVVTQSNLIGSYPVRKQFYSEVEIRRFWLPSHEGFGCLHSTYPIWLVVNYACLNAYNVVIYSRQVAHCDLVLLKVSNYFRPHLLKLKVDCLTLILLLSGMSIVFFDLLCFQRCPLYSSFDSRRFNPSLLFFLWLKSFVKFKW